MEENNQMKKKGMARNGFVVYALGVIDEMERGGRYGMAQAYRNSVKSLVQFTGSQRVPFQLFRFEMLKAYEGWLLQEGCCENTVHYYLRNLRAIYNRAVKEKVIRPRMNPFIGISTEAMPTRKRSLPRKWLKRIKNLGLEKGSSLAMSRDMFLFSFYACGMGFADMVNLEHARIEHEIICYERVKTGRQISFFAEPPLQEIIERYRTDSRYVWPVLSDDADDAENYKHYRSALVTFNRHLKKIAAMANITESLSSYMARHSWATAARNKLMPTAVISSYLGHASERTTQIYLDSFDRGVMKRLNHKVINLE